MSIIYGLAPFMVRIRDAKLFEMINCVKMHDLKMKTEKIQNKTKDIILLKFLFYFSILLLLLLLL